MSYPQPMQRDRLVYLVIPLAALIAILPLAFNGCSCGHDFDFHLLNWMEAARQFTHGNLHPHWAYTASYNAGEPRFVFYPPASWTLGAILGLILPWTWTPVVYTWIALTLSGFSMHRLTREFAAITPALFASVFYAVNPYMLFTAYERTAYAELLAAAWIPLLLHAILRQRITIPRIAIPVGLLWITNAPAAVMSCYALAFLATIRLITNPGAPYLESRMGTSRSGATAPAYPLPPQQSRLVQSRNTLAGTALGLGLAAFYIVPAACERRFVQIAMALVPGMRIQDNFLFHRTGDVPHDDVLHTASLIAVALISAIILSLALHRLKIERRVPHPSQSHRDGWDHQLSTRRLVLTLVLLTLAITFLLTPVSAFLWNHLPELAFLQFPWRLVAILAAVLALAIALALPSFRLARAVSTVGAISLAVCLSYPAYTAFRQPCDPEDTVSARLTLFHSSTGSEPTDEYTPTTDDNDALGQSNPAYWLSVDQNAKAPAGAIPGQSPMDLTLNSPIPQTLILNLRDYPSWRLTLNGAPISSHNGEDSRDDGLIAVPVRAGTSSLSITYAQTRDQTAGDAISLVSLISLLTLGLISKPRHDLTQAQAEPAA